MLLCGVRRVPLYRNLITEHINVCEIVGCFEWEQIQSLSTPMLKHGKQDAAKDSRKLERNKAAIRNPL